MASFEKPEGEILESKPLETESINTGLSQEELDEKYEVHIPPQLEVPKEVLGVLLKNAQENTANNIDILSSGDSGIQEKVDAGVSVATETPIVSTFLKKRFPALNFLSGLNDLQKDLRDDTKTAAETVKRFTKSVFSSFTFGLSDFIFKDKKKEEIIFPEDKTQNNKEQE